MRILFLGNNWMGWQALRWLVEREEQIVGLVLHPHERRRYGEEILSASRTLDAPVFDGSQLRCRETLEAIRALQPEIALSICFGYILSRDFLDLFPGGVINLHTSYLPYNRGANPNVWSIIEDAPAGVTLHYMDASVDTGDIIAQEAVCTDITDTGETLYRKLETAGVSLLQRIWPHIRSGTAGRFAQPKTALTTHRLRDLEQIDEIDLDRTYTARDLINILRARTFPPFPGAYIRDNGRKIYLRLQLIPEEGRDGREEGRGKREKE